MKSWEMSRRSMKNINKSATDLNIPVEERLRNYLGKRKLKIDELKQTMENKFLKDNSKSNLKVNMKASAHKIAQNEKESNNRGYI